MTTTLLQQYLKLPKNCWVNQKLPKTFFKRNFELTLSERKLLDDFSIIQQMEVLALVNTETANIPAYNDSFMSYEEIIILSAETTYEQFERQKNKIVELLQKYFPNPVLLLLHDSKQFLLSVAEKRINQNDPKKRVTEKIYTSQNLSWPLIQKSDQEFMQALGFDQANKLNLQAYYQHLIGCIIGLQAAQISGKFATRPYKRSLQDTLVLEAIQTLQETIFTLETRAKKETQMAELVKLNTEIQENKRQIQKLTLKLSN